MNDFFCLPTRVKPPPYPTCKFRESPSSWPGTEEVWSWKGENDWTWSCRFLINAQEKQTNPPMATSLQVWYESRGAKTLLSFLPHILWGHSSRNIRVHQILSGERNVSADKAGNYWNNCQLGHPYSYLLSLWALISNNPVPSTNRWEQRTLPGIMQLAAWEMRYQNSIKITGSATGTHSEKESGPIEGECLEK